MQAILALQIHSQKAISVNSDTEKKIKQCGHHFMLLDLMLSANRKKCVEALMPLFHEKAATHS